MVGYINLPTEPGLLWVNLGLRRSLHYTVSDSYSFLDSVEIKIRVEFILEFLILGLCHFGIVPGSALSPSIFLLINVWIKMPTTSMTPLPTVLEIGCGCFIVIVLLVEIWWYL